MQSGKSFEYLDVKRQNRIMKRESQKEPPSIARSSDLFRSQQIQKTCNGITLATTFIITTAAVIRE